MRPHTEPESMRIHALDTRNTIVHDIKLAISLASTTKSCKTGREAKAQRATKITGDPRITAGDQGSTKREPWAGQQQCRALNARATDQAEGGGRHSEGATRNDGDGDTGGPRGAPSSGEDDAAADVQAMCRALGITAAGGFTEAGGETMEAEAARREMRRVEAPRPGEDEPWPRAGEPRGRADQACQIDSGEPRPAFLQRGAAKSEN
jgi:hypothetical protein